MSIFICRDGQQYGPYAVEEVKGHLATGSLCEDDLAWYDGLEQWISLNAVLSSFLQRLAHPRANTEAKPQEPVQRTQLIRAYGRGEFKKFSITRQLGEKDPASISQKCKLTYYGLNIPEGLTRGEAEIMIEKAKLQHPEKAKEGHHEERKDRRIENWHDQAMSSDYVFAGQMGEPSIKMLSETLAYLDQNKPNWEEKLLSNDFATLLMERYPRLRK